MQQALACLRHVHIWNNPLLVALDTDSNNSFSFSFLSPSLPPSLPPALSQVVMVVRVRLVMVLMRELVRRMTMKRVKMREEGVETNHQRKTRMAR